MRNEEPGGTRDPIRDPIKNPLKDQIKDQIKNPVKGNRSKKIIIVLLIVAVAGGFIIFNTVNTNRLEAAGGAARNLLPVHWENPSTQTIISRVNARGSVEFVDTTTVFPTTHAQILEVHVSVGDEVQIGDLLITYDNDILDSLHDNLAEARLALRSAELGLAAARVGPTSAELLAAENQIEQARNNIVNIEAQLDQIDLQISQIQESIITAQNSKNDVEMLFNSGVATRLELDNAASALRSLEDQLAITQSQRDAAALGLPMAQETERLAVAQFGAVRDRNAQPAAVNQAQVQQVNIDQARLRIEQIQRSINEFESEERSTTTGTVLAVHVEEGELLSTGRPLMEIADITSDNLVVVVYVPENDAGSIALGQEVEISGGALGNHIYPGYIQMIHPVAAPRQIGTVVETVLTVEINPTNTERLRAGYTVDANIITQVSEDTIVVPLMSTLSEGGGVNFVFIINEDSILERRDITLGEFSEMYIEVMGLEKTDRIVSSPTHAMYTGMVVRPIPGLDLIEDLIEDLK